VTTTREPDDPARAVLDRLDLHRNEEICGSEPPPNSGYSDCWCTLPPDHPQLLCLCEICTARYDAPGWRKA